MHKNSGNTFTFQTHDAQKRALKTLKTTNADWNINLESDLTNVEYWVKMTDLQRKGGKWQRMRARKEELQNNDASSRRYLKRNF